MGYIFVSTLSNKLSEILCISSVDYMFIICTIFVILLTSISIISFNYSQLNILSSNSKNCLQNTLQWISLTSSICENVSTFVGKMLASDIAMHIEAHNFLPCRQKCTTVFILWSNIRILVQSLMADLPSFQKRSIIFFMEWNGRM